MLTLLQNLHEMLEMIGRKRTAKQLYNLGYYKEANSLVNKTHTEE